MVSRACFNDYLNLVKILFLQLGEGDYRDYAVQVSFVIFIEREEKKKKMICCHTSHH